MLDDIWKGILLEFSDIPTTTAMTQIIIRLGLAGLLGGMIGLQRERSKKPAGLRTHMLVCMGTAFVLAVPSLAGASTSDLSRIIQGVMAGIGFLGAGTILKLESQGRVEGLTTAAAIWFTTAIGVAVGLGRDGSAFIGTLLGLSILSILRRAPED